MQHGWPEGRGGTGQEQCTIEREHRADDVVRAVARAKQGDAAAIRLLYVRHADSVRSYARSIVRNPDDAEDIVQQVFMRMLSSIHTYEQRSVPFSAWLLRITRNIAIDHVRRTKWFVGELEESLADRREHDTTSQLRTLLCEALTELPPLQRRVLLMRHLSGYSPPEIALQLGRSDDSIHGLHHRGRRALKAALATRGAVPSTKAA